MVSYRQLLLCLVTGLFLFFTTAQPARLRKLKRTNSSRNQIQPRVSNAAQRNSSNALAVATQNAAAEVPSGTAGIASRNSNEETNSRRIDRNRRQKLKKNKKRGRHRNRKNKKSNRKYVTLNGGDGKSEMISTMRKMFGFDHMVPTRRFSPADALRRGFAAGHRVKDGSSEASNGIPTLQPPEFMVELYRSFSADKNHMHLHFGSQGNTVRSFFSIAGNTVSGLRNTGKPITIVPFEQGQTNRKTVSPGSAPRQMKVFAFNVTSIPASETIMACELRLDGVRKQMHREGTNTSDWSIVVGVYTINEMRQTQGSLTHVYTRLGDVTAIRASSSSAWQGSSLTSVITESRQHGRVLVVKFFDDSPTLSRNVRDASSAPEQREETRDSSADLPISFVVVETERPKRYSGDNRNYRKSPSQLANSSRILHQQAMGTKPILIVYCNDSRRAPQPTSAPNAVWKGLLNVTQSLLGRSSHRVRRSPRRRLPQITEPSSSTAANELPGDELAGSRLARTRVPSRTQSIIDNGLTEPSENVMVKLKSQSEIKKCRKKGKGKKKRCKRRRKGKKRKKCKRKQQEEELNRSVKSCSRKSMNVQFSDLGWDNWIIEPRNLEAYYCSGTCESSKMKKSNPTNHAILQALVKEFGNNPEIPAPCCVPEKMMTVSVLFFDENSNVVLKSYPDMSVETCGCR